MIDLSKYQSITEISKKYWSLFSENLEYDGIILKKSKRSNEEKDALLAVYRKELAKAIFDVFININPTLIEVRTGKKFDFVSVYGHNFDCLTEGMIIQLSNYASINSNVYSTDTEIKKPDGKGFVEVHEKSPRIGFEPPIWRNGKVVDHGFNIGLPTDDYKKITPELRLEHSRKWRIMSDSDKKKFMKEYDKSKFF